MLSNVKKLVLTLSLLSLITGCADLRYRYDQGLKWHLENEAAKRELDQQGFPQYTGEQ